MIVLHKGEQPIRSQDSKLTQLLTMTQTHKVPPQVALYGLLLVTDYYFVPALAILLEKVTGNAR